MINNASILDSRKLMTGKDGRIFIEVDGVQYFFAECESFNLVMNVTNTDAQPVGSMLQFAVNTGVSYSVTLTEMVVRDDVMMLPIQNAVREGKMPTFTFQAGNERWDGQEQRAVIRDCTPDGSIELLNLVPGEIIKRAMSFRANNIPEWIKTLTYA